MVPQPDLNAGYDRVEKHLASLEAELVEIRRHLHSHPELSGREFETTAFLSDRLTAEGIPHRLGPGGVGVITGIEAGVESGAPVVALRADIDALPIAEENDFSYCSRVPGVMHACGHDAHTTMALGAVIALHRAGVTPVAWRGIFQSSEEAGQGALDMVQGGALEGVDAIIAMHVDPGSPAGTMGVTAGPQTAFCQDFRIDVKGRGGHAARPFLSVDPVAISAHLITLIYQAAPRHVDARKPVVVTIGQVSAGHCANVIPDTALIRGTIRTLDDGASEETRQLIARLCAGTAEIFGAEILPTFGRRFPGVVNDPAVTAVCARAADGVVGPDNVLREGQPSMGAEDFADYLTVVPGCMIRLGAGKPGKKVTPLHTPTFDISETALILGARFLTRTLFEWGK